jgi:hypothetical protein
VNCLPLVEALVAAGWSYSTVQVMVAIGAAESGCNPHAEHRSRSERSVGALQLNVMAHKWISISCAMDYRCSAKAALRIWRKQGFDAWTVYRNGSYRQYLPRMR